MGHPSPSSLFVLDKWGNHSLLRRWLWFVGFLGSHEHGEWRTLERGSGTKWPDTSVADSFLWQSVGYKWQLNVAPLVRERDHSSPVPHNLSWASSSSLASHILERKRNMSQEQLEVMPPPQHVQWKWKSLWGYCLKPGLFILMVHKKLFSYC